MSNVMKHYDGSAPTYHEQYDPDLLWANAEYPANLCNSLPASSRGQGLVRSTSSVLVRPPR